MTESAPAPASVANWRSAPNLRWSFRHVAQLLPTARIPHGMAAPRALADAPRDFGGFGVHARDGATLDFDTFLRRTHTDGMLVLHEGRVVREWFDDGMDARTPHIFMSATKSVVGLLCGVLAGDGLLDMEAPVRTLVPEVAASGFGNATLRQLLDMRAAPVLDAAGLRRYGAATGWDPVPEGGEDPGGLHRFYAALGAPTAAPAHGGAFRYISANTDLLGWALERAAGQPLAEALGQRLWAPMGAADDGSITLDREGAPRATGGISGTLHDLARIGWLVADGGRRDGRTVVPAKWIDDIARSDPDRARSWAQGEFAAAFGRRAMHYRSGWYVLDDAPQTLFAMGIHGQHLFVDRDSGLVIAKLSAQPNALDPEATGLMLRALPALRRCALGD